MTPRGQGERTVYRITGAPRSHTEDINRRINRYLVSMTTESADPPPTVLDGEVVPAGEGPGEGADDDASAPAGEPTDAVPSAPGAAVDDPTH